MPSVKCKMCFSSFEAKPAFLKLGWGKYCSSRCQYKSFRTGEHMRCAICKDRIYKSQASLKRSKSKKYFCSKSCQAKWRNSQYVGTKHLGWKNGISAYRDILLRAGGTICCSLCMTKDRRVLAVHHRDENRTNNKLENLVWLCHNCHHLVHHDKVIKLKFSERVRIAK